MYYRNKRDKINPNYVENDDNWSPCKNKKNSKKYIYILDDEYLKERKFYYSKKYAVFVAVGIESSIKFVQVDSNYKHFNECGRYAIRPRKNQIDGPLHEF